MTFFYSAEREYPEVFFTIIFSYGNKFHLVMPGKFKDISFMILRLLTPSTEH